MTEQNLFRRFAANLVFSGLSEITTVFLFLLLILAARFLGDESYGTFTFALALASMFEIAHDFGVRYLLVREVARNPEEAERYLGNAFSLSLVLSLLTFGVVVVVVHVIPTTPESRMAVYIMEAATILRSFKFLVRFTFHGFHRFDLAAASLFIERVFLFAAGVTVLALGYGVIAFALVFLVVRAIDFVVTLQIFRWALWKPRLHFDVETWPALLRSAIPFALNGAFMLMLSRIDSVMISGFRGNQEVGWYNAAGKLIEAAGIIPVIVTATLFPSLSQLHHESKTALVDLLARGIKYVSLAAVPVAVIGTLLSEGLILTIFGAEYEPAVPAFRILLWTAIFGFPLQVGGIALSSIDRQGVAMRGAAAVLVFNVILNYLLIPEWGYVGAAASTLASQVLLATLLLGYLSLNGYRPGYLRLMLRPALGAICVVAAYWLVRPEANVIWVGALLLLLYLVVVTVAGVWDEQEIQTVKKHVRIAMERLRITGRQ